MTPEALIKKKIREDLKSRGAYVFSPVQMGLGIATVDILACLKGQFIAVEVKVPGKAPTARQDTCLTEVTRAGGVAFWCTSLEGFKEELWRRGL